MARGGKRIGAGRKPGITRPTKVVRVDESVTKEQLDNLPQLLELLAYWKADIQAHPPTRTSNPRYWQVAKLMNEIEALGYVGDEG